MKKITVLFSNRYNYAMHKGIASYGGKNSWHISHRILAPDQQTVQLPPCDGILIADEFSEATLQAILATDTTCHSLNVQGHSLELTRTAGDHYQIGRLAAAHFLERQFRAAAYFGPAHSSASQLRWNGFRDGLRKARITPQKIDLSHLQQAQSLPNPCACFCFNDILAGELLDHCLEHQLAVPLSRSILGVDDDPLFCETGAIPLSSVRHDTQQLGYAGAAQLDRLLRGEWLPPETLIPPIGITTRRSTDFYAVDHPAVLTALRQIQQHYMDDIGLDHLCAAAHCSRRTLQYAFKAQTGHTVTEELIRVRLQHATELLTAEKIPIADICARTGFRSVEYFHRLFKKKHHCTPRQFRTRSG